MITILNGKWEATEAEVGESLGGQKKQIFRNLGIVYPAAPWTIRFLS